MMFSRWSDRSLGYLKVFYDGKVTTIPLSEQAANLKNIKKHRFVTDGRLFRIGSLESFFDLSKSKTLLNMDPREEILIYKYERT